MIYKNTIYSKFSLIAEKYFLNFDLLSKIEKLSNGNREEPENKTNSKITISRTIIDNELVKNVPKPLSIQ